MILLKDALKLMDAVDETGKPVPFSVLFCTYSATRKDGGKLIYLESATKASARAEKKKGSQAPKGVISERLSGKNPHHSENKTRNFRVTANGEIRKARIRLIIEVNGQKVIY